MYKVIENYNERYMVSITGEVVSLPYHSPKKKGGTRFFPQKTLKAGRSGVGYLTVSLYSKGKARSLPLHRLVAETFLPNVEGKKCVNHKDGDKTNNHVRNLEWCTHTENLKHAYETGLRKPGFAGKCY